MKVGLSKFTTGTLASFLVGIFVATWFTLNIWYVAVITIFIVATMILLWPDIFKRLVLFCFLGLFLGLMYSQIYTDTQACHKLIYDQKIAITGQITGQPQIKPTKIQAIIEYRSAGRQTKILVDLPRYPEYQYGDVLSLKAVITDPKSIKPFDGFDYGQYLLDQNIRGWVKSPEKVMKTGDHGNVIYKYIYLTSQKFQQSLAQILPEPYASFQAGLILGNRTTQIPDSLTSAFNRTGTTHIIAVSGYNITIIISVLALCFAIFSRRFSFWATLTLILIFIIMTGVSASVVRAGILGALAAWGKLEGRRTNHTILILVVAFLMILFNPYQLHGDVSFQLSFLAFAGLMYISPILEKLPLVIKLPVIIRTVLTETMGAQIAVLPIIIYNFGIVSLVAPIVNILVLPTVPTSMLLGFLAGIAGMIWLKLGQIVGYIAWIVLKYIIVVVQTFSSFSWAAVVYKTGEWWWTPVYYTLMLILIRGNNQLSRSTD
jgi:competence protein ComEC